MRQLQHALDATQAHCRHAESRVQEGVARHLHAAAHLAKYRVTLHVHAFEMHCVLKHAPHAQRERGVSDAKPIRAGMHNERRDTAIVAWHAGKDGQGACVARRTDPTLHAM